MVISLSGHTPVNKPGGGIRPIAVSEVFYRLACIYALELVRDVLPDVFEPIQLGVGSVGGSERAVHLPSWSRYNGT